MIVKIVLVERQHVFQAYLEEILASSQVMHWHVSSVLSTEIQSHVVSACPLAKNAKPLPNDIVDRTLIRCIWEVHKYRPSIVCMYPCFHWCHRLARHHAKTLYSATLPVNGQLDQLDMSVECPSGHQAFQMVVRCRLDLLHETHRMQYLRLLLVS